MNIDLARAYAIFLEKLHEKCQVDRAFRFNFLDHSCTNLSHTPHTPLNNVAQVVQKLNSTTDNQSRLNSARADDNSNKRKRSNMSELSNCARPTTRLMSDRNQRAAKLPDRCHSQNTMMQIPVAAGSAWSNYNQAGQAVLPLTSWTTSAGIQYCDTLDSSQNPHNQPYEMVAGFQEPYTYDDLNDLSNTLMDSQFMELDRVITFEDANFHAMSFQDIWHA